MAPWLQRLITVVAGVGIGVVGVLVPAIGPVAIPAAAAVIGWAIPHTADITKGVL